MFGAPDEWGTGRRDHERSIAEITKARSEKKYLTLAAAPTAPGVDVKNPGKLHYASSFRANALKPISAISTSTSRRVAGSSHDFCQHQSHGVEQTDQQKAETDQDQYSNFVRDRVLIHQPVAYIANPRVCRRLVPSVAWF